MSDDKDKAPEPQQQEPGAASPEPQEPGPEPEAPEPAAGPGADRVGELEQKAALLEDKYRRAMADLANAHKRFQKERDRIGQAAVASFVAKLLPMIDGVARALKTAQETHDPVALIEGFKLVEAQMMQVLARHDIRPIETVGTPFDPEVHHAVTTEVTEAWPPGTVTEELGRGFTMGDFVIRPAQVKVAATPPDDEETDAAEGED